MRRIRRHRAALALVSCIALTIAGTSYAAISLPRNGGGTDQLRNNAVTSIRAKNMPSTANASNAATAATNAGSTNGTNAATAR